MAKQFVDMQEEQTKFVNALHSRQCTLILIEGESGTGKSTLVSRFKDIVEQENTPNTLINFRDSSHTPIDVIYSMVDLIGRKSSENLQAALLEFAQSNNIVIKDNQLMFGAKLVVQLSSELNQKAQNERRMWYRQITAAFFDDLAANPVERAVLFLDTYEQSDEMVSAWVNTHLLPLLGAQNKLQVVIAGQRVPKPDVEWEDIHFKLHLAGLELQYWYKYIELRQIKHINPEWVLALYKVFDGKPAAMITALDKIAEESLSAAATTEDKYWALLKVYLQQLSQEEQDFIEALSVFHWFEDTLAEYVWSGLTQSHQVLNAWSAVTNLPFAAPSNRGVSFHELYRNALLFHLWRNKRAFYLQIANLAAKYFDSDDPFSRVEQAYHLLLSDPERGRMLYYDLVVKFQDNGLFSPWHTLNQYGLEHVRYGRLDTRSAALVWEAAGQFSSIHGKNHEAIERLNTAQSLYDQLDDKEGLVRVLYSKATYESLVGQSKESSVDLQSAYDLALKMGNWLYAGHVMYRIAELTNFTGDAKGSYSQYQKSLEWFESVRNYSMQARNLMFMAETVDPAIKENKKNLYQKAIPLYEQGWTQYSNMAPDDPGFSPATFMGGFASKAKVKLFNLFNVAIDEGDGLQSLGELEDLEENQLIYYRKALSLYQKALPLALQMKDLRWSARVYLRIGDIYIKLQNTKDAAQFFQQALEQARRVDHKLYIGWSYVGMAHIERIAGNNEGARSLYLQAKELYTEVDAVANIGWQITPYLELLDAA